MSTITETGVQVTTGTPIALLIENTDQRSKDYSEIKDKSRPGHRLVILVRQLRPRLLDRAREAIRWTRMARERAQTNGRVEPPG